MAEVPAGRHRTPFVSVIVPARRAAEHLPASIGALLDGDWPVEAMEVLIAVSSAEAGDRTRAAAVALAEADRRVVVVDNAAGTTPAGLNAALRVARGEFIVRLDAHAVPAPDYVRACVDALRRTGAWAAGGPMRLYGRTRFGASAAAVLGTRLGGGGPAYRHPDRRGSVEAVYLGAWPRSTFERVGGFDEGLARNQDAELCHRVRAAGGVVWLEPGIRTATAARDGPLDLARQYFGYGAGRAGTVKRHPASIRARQALPAAVPPVGLALALAAPRSTRVRAVLAAVVGSYAAALGASALSAARAEAADLPWLPEASPARPVAPSVGRAALAMAIAHAAWGLGFWRGMFAGSVRARPGERSSRRREGTASGVRADAER